MIDYKKMFELALSKGVESIEMTKSVSSQTDLAIFNGKIDKSKISSNTQFTVRGLKDGKLAVVRFENDNEDIGSIVDKLIDNIAVLNAAEESFIYPGDEKYPEIKKDCDDFSMISTEEKIHFLLEMEKNAKEFDSRVTSVPMCQYAENTTSLRMINSLGLDVEKSSTIAYCIIQVIAGEGDATQTDYYIKVVQKFEEFDAKDIAKKAVDKVVSRLGAKPCQTDNYPVIIEKESMSELFEAFSPLFSGELVLRKISNYNEKIGEKLFSDKITIIEDPLHDNWINSQPFDDEGVACYTKTLVEKGVLKGILHNLKTAKVFNAKSTGSCAGSGVAPCNMYIQNGDVALDDIIKTIKKGVLINSISGLHAGVNIATGDFSLQSSGFMIEDGKKVKPITLVVLSGNFNDILNDVNTIANDLEAGEANVFAPSILFNNIKISGE